MTTHLPPLQVGAIGVPYVGALPEVDESYYGHGSYPTHTSSHPHPMANGVVSGSPAPYGTAEGMVFSAGAGPVTSDGQHQTYRGHVYSTTQPRSPVSPNSWYQSQESYPYPAQTETTWPSQTLQQSPTGDAQATHCYSGPHTTMNNLPDRFSPTSDSVPGDVSTYAPRQDVHDYQYQYQHQSPLSYHYDGQCSLPTPPSSSEYVSASTPEITHLYPTIPEALESQHRALGEHRRSRPSEHSYLGRRDRQGRPVNQPFYEESPSSSPLEPSGNPQDFYPSPTMSSTSHTNAHSVASHRRRSPSPMGHLPYPEDVQRGTEIQGDWANWISPQSHGWNTFEHPSAGHGAHPHMPCPQSGHPAQAHVVMEERRPRPMPIISPCLSPHSASIRQINSPLVSPEQPQRRATAPAPSRNHTLVEDTPKKPLTLACLFCRKRKIACGSPPPGQKDRTCNQCARRSLTCEYPVVSRRGMRPRASTEAESGHGLFQIEVRP